MSVTDPTGEPDDPTLTSREFFFGASKPSCKFPAKGTTHTGTVAAPPVVRQAIDFNTRLPATWPDGQAKMTAVVALATEERDPEVQSDDGLRNLYVKQSSRLAAAIRDALNEAGADDLAPGGELTVTYSHDGPPPKPGSGRPKIYTARYVPPPTS